MGFQIVLPVAYPCPCPAAFLYILLPIPCCILIYPLAHALLHCAFAHLAARCTLHGELGSTGNADRTLCSSNTYVLQRGTQHAARNRMLQFAACSAACNMQLATVHVAYRLRPCCGSLACCCVFCRSGARSASLSRCSSRRTTVHRWRTRSVRSVLACRPRDHQP